MLAYCLAIYYHCLATLSTHFYCWAINFLDFF
nr:MAG TPA: hypothetical protein [Caudoviricetes sp.]